jgi:anaerobic selenocysteine-containing dehydrogenase
VALTGNLGRPGSHYVPTPLVPFTGGASSRTTPVVGARIVSGLVPCNVIADEILTEHPDRYRAMIVEAANPAHSLADSPRMREALRALDTVVVIDCFMTETAELADYVLPAATQFEKAEATFFNFEFPHNYFHLRPRLFPPPEGPLPEAEIHARLCEALGAVGEADYAPLRAAAVTGGRAAYAQAIAMNVMSSPRLSAQAPILLYRTMDLPDELREGAVVLGLALRCAMQNPQSLARAGFTGPPLAAALALFEKVVATPWGVVFAVDEWEGVLARLGTKDRKVQLELPDLLGELGKLADLPSAGDAAFPFVLSAGERRSFTANTIIRDPSWRKKDGEGALRVNPDDATALGVSSGDPVRVTTRRGSVVVPVEVTASMQRGHVALPNGMGVHDRGTGEAPAAGVAPNELTTSTDRDPFVGTPWHKHVPARVERAA